MWLIKLTNNFLVKKRNKKNVQKGKRVNPRNHKGKKEIKKRMIFQQKRKLDTGDPWMSPKSLKKRRGNKFIGRKVLFSNLEGISGTAS